MNAGLEMAVYCGVIACASAAGGWLVTVVRMTHRRMEVSLSFVAGMMLGIGLLHMLPHAVGARMEGEAVAGGDVHGAIEPVVMWVLGGFLVMFLLQRFFEFHHHPSEPSPVERGSGGGGCDGGGGHHHAHGEAVMRATAGGDGMRKKAQTRWMGAAAGMGVHSLLEGVALSAAAASHGAGGGRWAGLGVFLVILLHKPFDAMTLSTLMMQAGKGKGWMLGTGAGLGVLVALGAVMFSAGMVASEERGWWVGAALGMSAGSFLYIALSDLLPELQFHTHDRWKLTGALLLGLGLAWGMSLLESRAHSEGGAGVMTEHSH